MKKAVVFVLLSCILIMAAAVGLPYLKESENIALLQKTQQKLEVQKAEAGEYPKSCQEEIENNLLGEEITINCAPAAYCLCTKLDSPFFRANSSSEQCAESKLNPAQKYYCVSNKPGGQQ